MYKFILDKKEELLAGRTVKYVAEKVGINKDYLSTVLCGKKGCSKQVAYCLVKMFHQNKEISDFFERNI